MSIEGKAQAVIEGQQNDFSTIMLASVWFGTSGVPNDLILQALNAAVGKQFSIEESRKISLRCANLRRAFNIQHGMTPEDDTLSPRLLEPPPDGLPRAVWFKSTMVAEYYQRMGWDEKTGKPLIPTLKALGLEDLISDLWG